MSNFVLKLARARTQKRRWQRQIRTGTTTEINYRKHKKDINQFHNWRHLRNCLSFLIWNSVNLCKTKESICFHIQSTSIANDVKQINTFLMLNKIQLIQTYFALSRQLNWPLCPLFFLWFIIIYCFVFFVLIKSNNHNEILMMSLADDDN